LDIVEATDDPLEANRCFFGFQECPLTDQCVMHDKWGALRNETHAILKTTTLFDLKHSTNP
jgi:DNA-binding IscR family transcriptional regulator